MIALAHFWVCLRITSAIAIAAGAPILDPIIGLGMTAVILLITRESWRTVRGHPHRNLW